MSRVVVAGVVNVRAARRFESFPIRFTPSTFDPGGISIRLSGTGWTVARTMQKLGTDVTFATYVGADDLGRLLGEHFTVELQAIEPRVDPPPGTPHIADVVLRARRR